MKTEAAVAWDEGNELDVCEVELEEPREGEVLIDIHYSGVCHTDAYTLSGADPEGKFPSILGHEGAGVVAETGSGVTSVEEGDHVIPLYTPECRECKYCLNPKTNLCQAIRETQGEGIMPDGTSRFSKDGETLYHFMGTSTFSRHTVLPEIAVAEIDKEAPLDKACLFGCGVTTGIGAVVNTAEIEPNSNVVVFGLGGIGLNVIQGAKLCGASTILGIDLNRDKEDLGYEFGMTDFLNPNDFDGRDDLIDAIKERTDGGADYSFECIGNVDVMRTALECCHKGWGESIIIGVAGAGEEISTRPFQLVTGRNWKGSAFGGYRGRTDVPQLVDQYMEGRLEIDSQITFEFELGDIDKAFDKMHEGEAIRSVIDLRG